MSANERTVAVHVDLTNSNCGPGWRSVDLVLGPPADWSDDRIREGAARHYEVPLDQVGRVVQRWTKAQRKAMAKAGGDVPLRANRHRATQRTGKTQ